jgi:hypothetical protein
MVDEHVATRRQRSGEGGDNLGRLLFVQHVVHDAAQEQAGTDIEQLPHA